MTDKTFLKILITFKDYRLEWYRIDFKWQNFIALIDTEGASVVF